MALVDPDGPEPDPVTPDPSDSAWDRCPWLEDLRVVPPNGVWPRLMSPPHPLAVASLGPELVEFAASRGVTLRWWQRLAAYRLLETDAEGRFVFLDALVSTARQVGKSVLLRELALWRLMQAERFGEDQLVVHTAKDLGACREVQRPARRWAALAGWVVRESNGREEIATPDHLSRWLVLATRSVYSYSASLAVADESWAVEARVIEDGLEPTLVERANGQLVLFSTAHRMCTSLVPTRRAGMFATWGSADFTSLIVEWSAPRGSDLADREAWRMASPHWTPGRERLLTAKLARATAGESEDPDEDDPAEAFRSQWLNTWPVRRLVASTASEPLADRDAWGHLADLHASPAEGVPVVVAVEDYLGLKAAAAAACTLPDGRVLVWGAGFESRRDALAWAAFTIGLRPECTLIVGPTITKAEAEDAVDARAVVVQATPGTTSAALPLFRSLVKAGRLAHSGDAELAAQATTVQLVPTLTGGLSFAHRGVRADLVKAAAWAVATVAAPTPEPMSFFVY